MKTYKVGVIRVLTTEDETVLNRHGKLLERYYPMFQVTSRCIPEQFEGVHDEETERQSIPKVVALAEEMYREGFDAVIVSCAGDPGVEEARKLLPIPVVGAGESVATLSLFFGERPAVLGILDAAPKAYRRLFGDKMVSCERGQGIQSTLDLMTEEGFAKTVEKGREQKAAGADVIALSCTGMSTIGIAPSLEEALGIPVMDPVLCEGLMTLFALRRAEAADLMKGEIHHAK